MDIPAPYHSPIAYDKNGKTIWQTKPNEEIIKAIAEEVFYSSDVTVKFLDQGVYNRVFTLTVPNMSKNYLFRVTNHNIHPKLKTDSEVATLKFLRRYTKVPVPEVKAWESSTDQNVNKLGFEWIIMERIAGVPLKEVWRDMTLEDKKKLVRRLAELTAELRKFPFLKIGSIYTTSTTQPQLARRCLSSLRSIYHRLLNKIDSQKSHLGQMVDQLCLEDERPPPLPEGSRGPFQSSEEWMKARVHMQEGYCKHHTKPHDTSKDLLEAIPDICSPSVKGCTNVLYHHDLSYRNIIVNQETFNINGIIDWEMTCVVPIWKARTYPKFLMANKLSNDVEPDTPSLEVYQRVDGKTACNKDIGLVMEKHRWDAKILRDEFDKALKAALPQDDRQDLKPHVIRRMRELEHVTELLGLWNNCTVTDTIKTWKKQDQKARETHIANIINTDDNDVRMQITP